MNESIMSGLADTVILVAKRGKASHIENDFAVVWGKSAHFAACFAALHHRSVHSAVFNASHSGDRA